MCHHTVADDIVLMNLLKIFIFSFREGIKNDKILEKSPKLVTPLPPIYDFFLNFTNLFDAFPYNCGGHEISN